MKFACITVVKNAEHSIAEWIAFHLGIGIDTIILLDNLSTDRTVEIARQFQRHHDVRLFDWALTTPDYQHRGFARSILECRGEFDWCTCIDADEFIVLPPGRTLEDLVDVPDNVSAIAMNWAMFGSSGHVARPPGLVIENYLHRADLKFPHNMMIKSIGRPHEIMNCESSHYFDVTGDYVDMAHRPIDFVNNHVERLPDYSGGKLHHYFVQSQEDWAAKLARGYHDMERKLADFANYDRNEVFDDSALHYLPQTLAILDGAGIRHAVAERSAT